MRPHTWVRPKPLLYLAGKTVLDHALQQFATLPGLDQAEYVFIVSPNQGNQIHEHMKKVHPDKRVHFIVQEEMRGQSDALALAREHFKGPVLIAFSDTLIETDLAFLEKEEAEGVAWVKPMPDPRRFGVAVADEKNLVSRLIEKPQDLSNNLVVVGFYFFRQGEKLIAAIDEQVKRGVSLKGEYFLTDAINIYLESGAKMVTRHTDVWLDAGIPDAILETNRHLLDHGCDSCASIAAEQNVIIIPPVYIPAGTEIEASVVGPHVTLAEGCKLKNVVIQNSIVEQNTSISNMVVEGSLIGRKVILEGKADRLNIGDDSWVKR
jgi:glucose-1-phosphate thymidylyltransferase